jgi:ABC-type oligopeptide transport system substrate-binding subunit
MRRNTQIWIAGVAVVAASVAAIVFLNQNDQITQQKEEIDQQELVAKLLRERSAEEDRFRQQEAAIMMRLSNLDAEQERNAATASANRSSIEASEKSSQERLRLENEIRELKAQQAQRARQTDCTLIQMRTKMAESAQDSGQVKALKDQWNANCANN